SPRMCLCTKHRARPKAASMRPLKKFSSTASCSRSLEVTELSRDVRLGVIGCGTMAATVHVPNAEALPGAVIVGYCDLDEAKARPLLDKHGGDYVTTDYRRLLADPDI